MQLLISHDHWLGAPQLAAWITRHAWRPERPLGGRSYLVPDAIYQFSLQLGRCHNGHTAACEGFVVSHKVRIRRCKKTGVRKFIEMVYASDQNFRRLCGAPVAGRDPDPVRTY